MACKSAACRTDHFLPQFSSLAPHWNSNKRLEFVELDAVTVSCKPYASTVSIRGQFSCEIVLCDAQQKSKWNLELVSSCCRSWYCKTLWFGSYPNSTICREWICMEQICSNWPTGHHIWQDSGFHRDSNGEPVWVTYKQRMSTEGSDSDHRLRTWH